MGRSRVVKRVVERVSVCMYVCVCVCMWRGERGLSFDGRIRVVR